jgi:NADPH:quinone reductase-like Zn-dependent oxidoreductase
MARHGLSLGGPLPGVVAEYVTLDEEIAVRAPALLTNEQASTLPIAALVALELTGGRAVDHVLELIGGDNLRQSATALASGGRVAQIGFLKGSEIVLSAVPMMLKRAVIQGITVGHRRAFEDMNRAIDEHGIKPVIEKVYGFDDALAAFDHLERGPFGKVVVSVAGGEGFDRRRPADRCRHHRRVLDLNLPPPTRCSIAAPSRASSFALRSSKLRSELCGTRHG